MFLNVNNLKEKTMENIADYEQSEPYLEAKQYMERMKQKHEESLQSEGSDGLPCEGLDLAEQGFSVTMYPVAVPCASLSYATVQWDTPDVPAEPPSSGFVNEAGLSAEGLNWTFNLSSTHLDTVINQGEAVSIIPETPDVTLTNKLVSSQKLDLHTESSQEIQTSVSLNIKDCSEGMTSGSEENLQSSCGAEILMDTQDPTSSREIQPDHESPQEERKPNLLFLPTFTFINQESSDSGAEEPEVKEQTEHWTEKVIAKNDREGESLDGRASFQVEVKKPEETDLSPDLHRSDHFQESIITDQTDQLPELQDHFAEPIMNIEEISTSNTVIKIKMHETLKHVKEPVGSVEHQFPENTEDTENGPTEPAKPSETAEAEPSEKNRTSEQIEKIICLDEKESSEHKRCLEEEKPEPVNMELSAPTEQLQRLDETDLKQHSVQTDEDSSCVQNMSPVQHVEEESVLDTNLVCHHMNGSAEVLDRAEARRLAEKLYRLDGFQRTDVVKHLDKDNKFSSAVGEEFLKYFDFTSHSLDQALRSFLKEVVLIGETQERERVLQHFSTRFQHCNPDMFSSAGSVLTLTCAVMLLNTDLHGQNVGKPMTLAEFVSNLDGMNAGENFNKDCLKSLYNSIRSSPLRWAVEEDVLARSMMLEQDSDQEGLLRSKSNPFQDLPHDKKATVFQKGFLKRKAHADIDGKRTPWGKRSWKTFYAVLRGMVLYLQKDEYRMDWQSSEEVVSIHHALAERALNYTKRPHVFRLQTADWRVFLFEAASTEQMNSWIGRINLVSALFSSPPFPAAVGSQKKFFRPILPASQSNLSLDKQLQSHAAMLQSFQRDLSAVQEGAPDSRKIKARELEELRQREEYLQHEKSRYEVYIKMLEAWQTVEKPEVSAGDRLNLFDEGLWQGVMDEEEDEADGLMKRSHSSPSLELETPAKPVVKVRRNISERRTYRKIVIPRRNKEI